LATHHVEWHERIRAVLDAEIPDSDFVLWILVAVEPDASVDEGALLRDVRAWLEGLDVERVFAARDEPTHMYEDQGVVIRFTAVPRAPAARGLKIRLSGMRSPRRCTEARSSAATPAPRPAPIQACRAIRYRLSDWPAASAAGCLAKRETPANPDYSQPEPDATSAIGGSISPTPRAESASRSHFAHRSSGR
jgi:hypothetical protein